METGYVVENISGQSPSEGQEITCDNSDFIVAQQMLHYLLWFREAQRLVPAMQARRRTPPLVVCAWPRQVQFHAHWLLSFAVVQVFGLVNALSRYTSEI
jgi:hypothetical protein